jgi:hypothetical protein
VVGGGGEFFCELVDGFQLRISNGGKWCGRCRVLEGVCEGDGNMTCSIGRQGFEHFTMVGKKFDGVGDAFGGCPGDVDAMAAVVFGCASEIPAVYAVAVPGAPVVGSFVDGNSGSWWRKGGLVVVGGSIQLRFGRQSRIDA